MRYKLETVGSDRLFFDQYRYTACLQFMGASALRHWRTQDQRQAEFEVMKRWKWRAWRNQHVPLGGRTVTNLGGSWRPTMPNTTLDDDHGAMTQQLQNVLSLFAILRARASDIKCTFAMDTMYLYCNDPEILDEVADQPGVKVQYAREVSIDRPRDVILLDNPTHSHRSYFREKFLAPEPGTRLLNWLAGQQHIRMAPSLLKRVQKPELNDKGLYVAANWFIDHDNQGELLMLQMVLPNIIRKTLEVHKR